MGKSKLLGVFAFGLASVMNPAFFSGCGSVVGPRFSFGEMEVVALVDVAKAQRYELASADGTYEIVVELGQARGDDSKSSAIAPTPVRVAHACGSRTFMRSAAACVDVTEVPVAGTVTVKRIAPDSITMIDNADATGVLRVIGTALTNAEIDVKTAEGSVTLRSDDAKTFALQRLVVADKVMEPAASGG